MTNKLLEEIKRLKSIADIGLLYASNEYEKDRYIELQDISLNLLHLVSDHSIERLKETFPLAENYPTAKVDIRVLILSADQRILLVKEKADNRWSLPGGWADIGYSPKEVIIKECKEETGLEIIPQHLLAVFDKRMHAHPPQLITCTRWCSIARPCPMKLSKASMFWMLHILMLIAFLSFQKTGY